MNWEQYKTDAGLRDPETKAMIEEAECKAAIIASIISRRTELGLSQRELASLCGIPQSSLARIEANRTNPRIDTLLKLFSKLGLSFRIVADQ